MPRADDGPDAFTVRIEAVASPGLLARCAAVLNPHPVTAFSFTELPGGAVRLTVRVDQDECDTWQARRVSARLRRIVDVTAVESTIPTAPNPRAGR